jgi:hypothetical protein
VTTQAFALPAGAGAATVSCRSAFAGLLTALLLWASIQGLLVDQLKIFPRILSKLDELVILGLYLAVWLDMLRRGRIERGAISGWAIAFLGAGAVSLLLNGSYRTYYGWAALVLLQYYFLFPIIRYFRLEQRATARLVDTLLWIGVGTAPIAIWQYFVIGRVSLGFNPGWDFVVGPFFEGTANVFAYLCGFLVLLLIAQLVTMPGDPGNRRRVMQVVVILFPFFLSSGKSAYYFLPVALLVMFYRYVTSPKMLLKLGGAGLLVLGAFYFVSTRLYGANFADELSIEKRVAENTTTDDLNMGRIMYLVIGQQLMRERPWGEVLGVGPGMFSSYPAREFGSPYLSKALVGEHTKTIPSNIVSVRTEFGDLGLALYLLLILGASAEIARRARRHGAPAWIAITHRGCAVYFAFGAFAELTWESQVTAFYFWLLTGLLYRLAGEPAATTRPLAPAEGAA